MKLKQFAIPALLAAALVVASPANAASYSVAFESNDNAYSFDGTLTTDSFNKIIGMDVTVNGIGGGAVTSVTANPSFPSVITSTDGAWTFDNAFSPVPPYAGNPGGWLFATVAGEFNLWNTDSRWGTGAGAYTLGVALPSGSGFADTGIYYRGDMTVAPVPEPETYAMMLAGLGLLGVFAKRRKQKAVA